MAKKKSSKKKRNRTIAPLAFECRTSVILNESWKSKVQGNDDGAFRIGLEDIAGYFDGFHSTSELIRGRCSGNGIWFVMPPDDPQFFYKGKFSGPKKLKGTRMTIPVSFRGKRGTKLAPDDWEADKTT